MRSVKEIVWHEVRELLPPAIYFFFMLNAMAFSKKLMLEEYGIPFKSFVVATVGALVMAKVILIVGVLPFMEPFRKVPITYNVLWKTVWYFLVALVVQLLEYAIPNYWKHGNLGMAFADLRWPQFWAVQIWSFLLFLIFCTFRAIFVTLGAERSRELFFGAKHRFLGKKSTTDGVTSGGDI